MDATCSCTLVDVALRWGSVYKLLVHFRLCMEVEKDEPMAAAAVAAMLPDYGSCRDGGGGGGGGGFAFLKLWVKCKGKKGRDVWVLRFYLW